MFVLVGASVLAALMLASCGEYCEYSETICDGDRRILRCIESDGFADHSFGDLADACEIGETCVDSLDGVGLRTAVCSFTGEPDPRCSPEGLGITHVCADATTVIQCNAGYAAHKRTCDGACVRPGASAFCSVDTVPSPTCEARELCEPCVNSRCDEACPDGACTSAVVACREGYAIDRVPCAADEDCVRLSTRYRRAYCASTEPCDGNSTVCVSSVDSDGNRTTRIEGCALGRVVSMTCDVEAPCEQFGVLGTNNRPTPETQAECMRR